MTYKINGTEILTQPTEAGWVGRDSIGIDGNGHQVYVGVRNYRFKWDLIDPQTYDQLQTFYNLQGNTGTVVVDLPYYTSGSYSFFPYSGCVMEEPKYGKFFVGHYDSVDLIITNIRT